MDVTTDKARLEIDYAGFSAAMTALEKESNEHVDYSHFRHLRRIEIGGKCATLAGFALALVHPLLGAILLSQGLLVRWLLAHHICHGGYDRVPGIPDHYTSKKFAVGLRRFIDWFDWMHPDAWRYEHDFLHHYYTGEDYDPDLVERNAEILRNIRLPKIIKYLVLFLVAISWKFSYYAANTLNGLEIKKHFKEVSGHRNFINLFNFFDLRKPMVRKLWFECWGLYILFHFIFVPALFLPLGQEAATSVLIARVIAELLHNLHMFIIIVTNHAGDDLYKFHHHYRNKAEFYVNQVLGSVNFHTGTQFLDISQMWLNYQIEHHLFPKMTMLQYRQIQPRVKELCAEYGVPYIQESVFKRLRKLVAICVGDADMRVQKEVPVLN